MEWIDSVVRRIQAVVRTRTTPIHVGHRYVDHVTGERFDVISVGRKTEIERRDANRRPSYTVENDRLRAAIDAGAVEHDESVCPNCSEPNGEEESS